MAYVPPAKRGSHSDRVDAALVSGSSSAAIAPPNSSRDCDAPVLATHLEIHNHYWPKPAENDSTIADNTLKHSTLNASASQPRKLKYVMLFKEANPRWPSERIIFAKSNLGVLPGGDRFTEEPGSGWKRGPESNIREKAEVTTSEVPVEVEGDGVKDKDTNQGLTRDTIHMQTHPEDVQSHPTSVQDASFHPDVSLSDLGPIAVFEQAADSKRNGPFHFVGYHKISRLQFLAPRSRDLIRMLEQKFSEVDQHGRAVRRQRSRASWETSLSYTWAVIKFEPHEEASSELPPPDIKVKPSKENRRGFQKEKTVNELLGEMRLGS